MRQMRHSTMTSMSSEMTATVMLMLRNTLSGIERNESYERSKFESVKNTPNALPANVCARASGEEQGGSRQARISGKQSPGGGREKGGNGWWVGTDSPDGGGSPDRCSRRRARCARLP